MEIKVRPKRLRLYPWVLQGAGARSLAAPDGAQRWPGESSVSHAGAGLRQWLLAARSWALGGTNRPVLSEIARPEDRASMCPGAPAAARGRGSCPALRPGCPTRWQTRSQQPSRTGLETPEPACFGTFGLESAHRGRGTRLASHGAARRSRSRREEDLRP